MSKKVILKVSTQYCYDTPNEIDITEWFNQLGLSIDEFEEKEHDELLSLAIEEGKLEFWIEKED